jgi:osmotically-inducible protein OsmY
MNRHPDEEIIMRDRRDDERSFRGPMGMGRDEDRFRDRDRERGWERDRPWRSEQDMGGSHWSGASGRGGYESRFEGPEGGGWGERMGGSDLGFAYRGHERSSDLDDRGPHYGKGPKGYKRSDERMLEEVCDRIACQGYIDASDVEVKVENGTVILTGTVGQRHHKRALEQMVERVHGVEDVQNALRLTRAEQAPTRSQVAGRENGDQGRASQLPNGKNART